VTAAVCAFAGQVVYFKLLSYHPYSWHCLPALALVAVLADAGSSQWLDSVQWRRIARLAVIALYAVTLVPAPSAPVRLGKPTWT